MLLFGVLQYTGEDANVSADSAGDDVYTWNVELWKSAFRPDCQLAKVRSVCCRVSLHCLLVPTL